MLSLGPFPSDYTAPISPDFMILPVCLLRWQVDCLSSSTTSLRGSLIKLAGELVKLKIDDMRLFNETSTRLFELRSDHSDIHRRYLFAQELAKNLLQCFDNIERRARSESDGGKEVAYSSALREVLANHQAILDTLKILLDGMPSEIVAQQNMIDNRTRIMIAKNSDIAADEARKDSTAIRTITVLTLIFLPSALVAVCPLAQIKRNEEKAL
jgi:hypothetical protein